MTFYRFSLLLGCIFICFSLFGLDDDNEEPCAKSSDSTLGIADTNDNRQSGLTNIEAEPSTYVHNSVSIISGDFTEAVTDYTIPGPDPLPIQRVFSSGEQGNGSLCYGAHWGNACYMETSLALVDKNKEEKRATIIKGGGSRMTYAKDGYHNFKLHKKSYQKGLTNTSSGIISGRTNPLNDRLIADKKYKVFKLTSGAGIVSEFKQLDSSHIFNLDNEKKPNGLELVYTRDKRNRLIGIKSQNKQRMPLASFSCDLQKESITVHTSNNRTISYEFEQQKNPDGKKYYLKKVSRPEEPDETFEYAAASRKTPNRLIRKSRPDGRTLGIEYYEKGENPIPFANLNIQIDSDPRIGRVRTLKAPVGHDSTLQTIYKFAYGMKIVTVNEFSGLKLEMAEGSTKVYDVYNHLTRYFYNSDQRLELVEKHKGEGPDYELYTREKLFWDGHKLTNRIFETREGTALYAKQYDYDQRGNVWRQTLWGNLSGYNDRPIAYPPTGYPEYNGCEFEFKLFTYSDDGLNLTTSQTEGKTAHTAYKYHPGTDLLASKLFGPIGSIASREFYEYDQNGILVLEIKDDGTTPDKDDMTGVTQRKVRRILPSASTPIGFPVIIEDKYVDLATGYEGFIQRTVQSFTQEGWLSRREVYDENNEFAYVERWEYDTHGNIILHEDPAGRITCNRYDANFNLIYVQGPNADFHTEYSYDFSDRPIKKSIVFASGDVFSEEYLYDMRSNLVATRDVYGNQTSYRYDEFGRRIKTIHPEVIDANGWVTAPEITVAFDELSHPVATTDARGFTTEQKSTLKGSPYEVSHSDGSVDTFTYNVDGTVQRQSHPNGSYTLFEYDYQKRPVIKETYSHAGELLDGTYCVYSGFSLLSERTLGGVETRNSYDPRGRLVETLQGSSKTTYTYDSMGRTALTKTFYGEGANDYIAKACLYDVLGRVIEEREEDNAGNILKKSQYGYDIAGNQCLTIEHTQAGPSITSTTFDPFGRPLEVVNPEGNKTVTRYDYTKSNALGQLVAHQETTDPSGNVTATTKDALGRVTTVIKRNSIGEEIQKAAYFYDANGNKTKQIDTVFTPDRAPHEITTTWEYDPCNRLVATTEAVGTPEQKCTQSVYNNFGQKEKIIKPDGVILMHSYDELGRLHTLISSDGTISIQYTYDRRGKAILAENLAQGTSTVCQYDDDSHLVAETLANGLTVNYTYDLMGRPTAITLPDSSSVHYIYAGSRLKFVRRCGPDGSETFVHTYSSYDLGGMLLEETYAGVAGSSNYTYDILGRLISSRSPLWSETIQGYDKAGNLLSRTVEDTIDSTPYRYEYDDLSQMKQELGATAESYQWDSLYNRISKNGSTLVYNALNQLIDDGTTHYSYDYNGNLISKSTEGETVCFSYDALDRLTEVATESKSLRYTYDELNRRLTKSTSVYVDGSWAEVSTDRFLYQGQNEVGLIGQDGRLEEYRTLGTGKGAEIGATILIELQGNAYVPIHDHNGNIAMLVDPHNGATVETYRYTAFGKETLYGADGELISKPVAPWRFSSKRTDEETGFVYFGRRYYFPEVGRWITADPIGFGDGPNLYAYVLNNPLTRFDLYGLFGLGGNANCWAGLPNFGAPGLKDSCEMLLNGVGSAIETWGEHFIPIPGLQDYVRSAGMQMQNKGMDDFKTWRQNQSCYKSLGLPEKHPKYRFLLIGGLLTTEAEMKKRAEILSELIGGYNVHYFYNSTHGFAADALEWGVQRAGFYTRSVKQFAKCNRYLINDMGGVDGGGTILQYSHSQGGEIADSLPRYLSPKELHMIHVKTFGSPAQIAKGSFGNTTNYVSERDPVPLLHIARRGPLSNNTTVLPSKAWIEHEWNCSTYQEAYKRDVAQINDTLNALLSGVNL